MKIPNVKTEKHGKIKRDANHPVFLPSLFQIIAAILANFGDDDFGRILENLAFCRILAIWLFLKIRQDAKIR